MNINESTFDNYVSSEKDERPDINELSEFEEKLLGNKAKTELFIGSDKCSELDEKRNKFNKLYYKNENVFYNKVYALKVKSSESNTFDSLRLVYVEDRPQKARFFLRNYYSFFKELVDGTIFIDYLYVAVLNIVDEDIPFIINGPIINLDNYFKIVHYPRVIPIDFFPFIPSCYLNYDNLKTNYRRKLNDLKLAQKDIDAATVSDLYRISLNDDIALVGITFNTSNKIFEVNKNDKKSDFLLRESLIKKLNNKKLDIKVISYGKENDNEYNRENEDNKMSLKELLLKYIDKGSNVLINKQDDTFDKDKVVTHKFERSAQQDFTGGKVELIQNYKQNITDKAEQQNYSKNQSSSEICVNSHYPDTYNNTNTDSIAEQLLSKSDEKLTNKIDKENSQKLSSVENINSKQKARINTIVRSSSYQEYKNSKKSSVAKQGQIKSQTETIDLNSQINTTPNQNAVSPRKHVLSIVTVIIFLCLLVCVWHYKEEVKIIYSKMYNVITEDLDPKEHFQEISKKTIREPQEYVDLKSDFLYDIDRSGSINNNDRVEIMQKILIKEGFNQKLDNTDWKNTKENVRQYLKKNSVQFDEDELNSIGKIFKHFEDLHSTSDNRK